MRRPSKPNRTRLIVRLGAIVVIGACTESSSRANDQTFDLVISNGRVMDPASGMDAPRNVGIVGGFIRAVSEQPLRGRDSLDARGMVVAPGFIDLHQHAQDTAGYRVEVLDGTTTALELEGGTVDIDAWYDTRAGESIINHGVSVGHDGVRSRAHARDEGTAILPRNGRGNGRNRNDWCCNTHRAHSEFSW